MHRFAFPSVFILAACAAQAVIVQVDYRYDLSTDNFFVQVPLARVAVEAAAADISSAILPSLDAVTSDVFTGTSGNASATLNWSLEFSNPSNGNSVTVGNFAPVVPDVITLYVGMRPLNGSTLGQGGPVGAGLSISGSGSGAALATALNRAEAASNAVMPRGGGPIVASLSGQLAGSNYTVRAGAFAGSVTLDNDTNNDGAVDSFAQLESAWHFDPTTPVASGKIDFYSVALHEMLHALGIGASDTWTSLRNGTTWLGINARSLNDGSGQNLLSSDGAHINNGVMSPRLSDGVMQEVAMDPSVLEGARKYLTQMDAAFLRDIGYETIPEPSAGALLASALLCFGSARSRQRSA